MKNERTVHIRYKDNPVLLDKIIQDLQRSMVDNLPWLNAAFGRAYKLVEHRQEGGKFVYPAAYNGKGEYVSLLPNDNYGNFSWFDIYDPQIVTTVVQSLPQFEFRGAIVFWYDLRTINPDTTFIYSEEVKDQVIGLLTTPGIIRSSGRIDITEVYERFENIYRDYALEKIYNNYEYSGQDIQSMDRQFFMYPYAGLRVEFNITTREECYRFVK